MTEKSGTLMRLQQGGREAGKTFYKGMTGDREEVREIRAIIRANPETALVALQHTGETGLSSRGEADALDLVIGEIKDPEKARELMGDHLTPARRAELLQGRGDLPATAAYVAETDDVITALLGEIVDDLEENNQAFTMLALRTWAHKLQERGDWEEILDREVGSFTIRQYLLLDVLIEHDKHERRISQVPANLFTEVGLDPDEGVAMLKEMADAGIVPDFDPGTVEVARKKLAERRLEIQDMDRLAEAAQAELNEIDEDDDDL